VIQEQLVNNAGYLRRVGMALIGKKSFDSPVHCAITAWNE